MTIGSTVLVAAGLGLLIVGAELLIRGAVRLAFSLGVSPMVIGLTIVSVGTSAPELAVGITASLQGNGSITVGNIAGTNILNLLLILCLSAMLQPLPINMQVFKLDLPVMIGAALLLWGLALNGLLSQLEGGLMVILAILYTMALIRMSRAESQAVQEEFSEEYGEAGSGRIARQTRLKDAGLLAIGIWLTVTGANWLVDGSVAIARALGVSDAIIGLTIVAIGTSAPELVTTIIGTIKNEREVAIGNLLGSSIYNILVIMGLTCLASPGGVPVERELILFDLPLMTAVVVMAAPVFWTGKEISRLEGGLGVAGYLAYMVWLLSFRL